MTTARYNINIGLTLEEYNRMKALQAHGVKVIDIFRAGLDEMETRTGHLTEENS